MREYQAEFDWMPLPYKVPARVQKSLLPFTPTKWGWTIWYLGKTRFVCGKKVPLEEVTIRWGQIKTEIDAGVLKPVRATDNHSLREGLSLYFKFLDHRLQTGTPKSISPVTVADYQRALVSFGRFQIEDVKFSDVRLADFGPKHFQVYAERLATRSPTSFARNVATIHVFFSYCKTEGLIAEEPNYGSYFTRPPQHQIRDRRMQQQKSWDVRDLWIILEHAYTQERAWIGLALSGAMDNADIAHLSFGLFDQTGMLLDYRRRKTGRTARLIPLHPMARQWLDDYLAIRPTPFDPAYKDLIFLTPNGLPLQRTKQGKAGLGNHIDYVAHCWDKLLRRAGLRDQVEVTRVCVTCGKERKAPRALCCGVHKFKKKLSMSNPGKTAFKGFRSLRTTFANLIPHGFSDERKLIMGHSGDITLDHYVEKYGTSHLEMLIEEVWRVAFTAPISTPGTLHK